jgi:hypothetical protein
MAGVSAVAAAIPYATGGGRGARLLYQADGAGIGGGAGGQFDGFLRDRYFLQKELRSSTFPLNAEQEGRLKRVIAQELRYKGTEESIAVADAIQRGGIHPLLLGDEAFGTQYRRIFPDDSSSDLSGLLGFTTGNENVYIRAQGATYHDLVLRTLHEGIHVNRIVGDLEFYINHKTGKIASEFAAHYGILQFARSRGWLHHVEPIGRTEGGIIRKILQVYDWTY